MKQNVKRLVIVVMTLVTVLACTGILTSCQNNTVCYYGCPNSKRINKLVLKKVRKIKK